MKKNIKKYLASGGAVCPFCGSEEITGEDFDISGEDIYQEQGCDDCNKEWIAHFKLAGVHIGGEYHKKED